MPLSLKIVIVLAVAFFAIACVLIATYVLLGKPPAPGCEHTHMSLLRSTNEKVCLTCYKVFPWPLDEGQLPLVANNRMVKRHDNKT